MVGAEGAKRGWALGVLDVGLWVLAGGLGVLAALALLVGERTAPLIGVAALGPLPYLPALAVAVGAAARRRWRLLGLAVAVLVVGGVVAGPFVAARAGVPAAARTAPQLRVLSWNLRRGAAAPAAARAILAERPDVVILQEVTAAAAEVIRPALAEYPGRHISPKENPFGTLIATRTRLTGSGRVPGFTQGVEWAVVDTDRGPLRVVGVHTTNPMQGRQDLWREQLGTLRRFLDAPGPPTLLAGDFNASLGNDAFRALLADDVAEASAARGHLWAPTWPATGRAPFAFLRLDHVLTTRGLVAVEARRGGAGGSDHRGVRATIALVGTG